MLRSKPEARFLIITTDKPSDILQKAEKLEIPSSKLIIKAAKRQEVPIMLSLSNISIFFIKAVYSKKASCPTKLGETLCMGIPVICNSGVGDVDQIIKETRTGILVDDFTEKAYEKAINEIDSLIVKSKNSIREAAIPYFSLDEGAEKYAKIYFELSAQI